MNGHENPEIGPKVMNFFVARNYISAVFSGPCLMSIQRVNAKLRDTAIIYCDPESIHGQFMKYLSTVLTVAPTGGIAFSLAFNGTKVCEAL